MSQRHIQEYALLSDCNTAALVHRNGSIDWYCPARFDASSVFGRLLDDDAGYWEIQPIEAYETERRYVQDTLVLQTEFTTATGKVRLTDALALENGARGHQIGKHSPHVIVRQVQGIEGEVSLRVTFRPKPEYGLTIPLMNQDGNHLVVQAGSLELILMSSHHLNIDQGKASAILSLRAGETADFALLYRVHRDDNPAVQPVNVAEELANTQAGWQSWADQHHSYEGLYVEQVRRSMLTIQGLTFHPTGAVIAAATTSLPEHLGGTSNWDYRYVWLRDLTLTIRALWIAACPDEVQVFFGWISRALGDASIPEQSVQIVYNVEGERDLAEYELRHLNGFSGSRPVRVGNAAWSQKQLDVFGEVIDAIYLFRDQIDDFDEPVRQMIIQLADRAAQHWQEPDSGMWEARDRERHYLTSKVMCWVALDRAVKLAPRLANNLDTADWKHARDAVRQAVLEQGWNEDVQAFTGAFGSDHLDASVLLLPLVDFLPATDPRMAATIRTIERELSANGQVYRWKGDANAFVICTFWLVECLALLGEQERAQTLFEETLAYANDLGLIAEMNDPETGALIGNFPQVFSHVGLINAAWRLSQNGIRLR